MMGGGTHPANSRGDLRHLLGGATLHELLKPTQLRDLEEGSLDAPALVEEDLDLSMAFQTRDGIDRDPPSKVLRFGHCDSPQFQVTSDM